MLNVHVICCNDGVEFAVVADKTKAIKKMEKLAEAYFIKNVHAYRNREEYKNRCYWHIHTVNGEEGRFLNGCLRKLLSR